MSREGFRLDAAISIRPGRTVALLGPNGAGKTTTVLALAGLLPLERGRIELGGRVLDDPSAGAFVPAEDRGIGVVFQDYLLFPHLSALDNVAFGPRSSGKSRRRAELTARSWMERVGVAALTYRRPDDLSGGQAQRVALARALAGDPQLLLLDEPLAALDVTTRSDLRRTLRSHLDGFAGPRLLITHDPTEAFLLADEILVMEGGRIIQRGDADDIRLRPRTPYVADLAGANLLAGTAADGVVVVNGHELHIADRSVAGPVLATIHARAIAIHRVQPEGSPRNTWATTVVRVEHYGDRVRLQTGAPMALTAEITPSAERALALASGVRVWVSIKATEIGIRAN